MIKQSCRLVAGLTLLSVLACVRPDPVVNDRGPAVPLSAGDTTQFGRFARIWQDAKTAAETQAAVNSDTPADIVTASEIKANRRLLNAGLALIYNSCNDFFIAEGAAQQGLSFSRDLTGALVPTVTGSLGLIPSAGIAIPIVGIVGGGITSGISIAAANFLFGAENIDDVRTLTMNALSAHESTVKAVFANSVAAGTRAANAQLGAADGDSSKSAPQIVAAFDWVTVQLADHQAICQPAKILSLTKQAISKSNICAYTTSSSTNGTADKATPGQTPAPAAKAGTKAAAKAADATASPPAAAGAPASPLPARVGVQAQTTCDPVPANIAAN